MPRPPSVIKRLKEIVKNLLQDYVGGRAVPRQGRPPMPPIRMGQLTQLGRARAERPTRDFDSFAYVQDVLANMPAAVAALRQLAEDVTLDENGDSRAWTLAVKVDPVDDDPKAESRKTLKDFKETCQRIFDNYALRTGIGYNAKNYVFKFMAAGDCFAEQTVSLDSETGLGRIERIRELPTWQMRPIWDETGELIAYEQWLQSFGQTTDDTTADWMRGRGIGSIRWEVPAQIIHWRFHPSDYIPTGDSIFSPLRGRWEQFKLVELDLISCIHTHSVDPEVFKLGRKNGFDRVSDEEIAEFKQQLLDNPADINRFYVVREGEVEIDFAKTGSHEQVRSLLEAHRDLENRFVEALGVPGHISGNIKDVAGRHVSSSLDQKYARKINSLRQDFTNSIYPSLLLEFALHGIDFNKPEQYGAKYISLELSWPDLGESRTQREASVQASWALGLYSHETSLRRLGFNDPEGELELIKAEQERGDLPLGKAQGTSPNGEQGRGVGKDTTDAGATGANQASIDITALFQLRQMVLNEVNRILEERLDH